ncbi:hypothetical protein GCM10023189_36640 [Nibrella saemangeumensis]|uniref:Uncharacterized protein n=1 Tax=Nibrella saemangeumensis TaxID=1084526 RepID=A0ABP8N8H2_9BACT
MWYFTIKQQRIKNAQYQQLQKIASLTEVEIFNEPYENYCLFEVPRERYRDFIDHLDLEGIAYDVSPDKPTREKLLDNMR